VSKYHTLMACLPAAWELLCCVKAFTPLLLSHQFFQFSVFRFLKILFWFFKFLLRQGRMTPSYLQGAELQPWLGLLQITSSLCLQLFLPRLVFFFFFASWFLFWCAFWKRESWQAVNLQLGCSYAALMLIPFA
jgi:hypothetical protein